jgi:hypothetical protein
MTLLEALKTIPDSRRRQGQLYDLAHILLLAILATCCGADSYSDIALFISKKFDLFKRCLGLSWKKPPVTSTVHKIISEASTEEIEKAFRLFSKQLLEIKKQQRLQKNKKQDSSEKTNNPPPCLAIDGKTLRGSYNSSDAENGHVKSLISLIENQELIIIAHLDLEGKGEKGGEMTGVQDLLTELNQDCDFQGFLVTTDALHCQKKL